MSAEDVVELVECANFMNMPKLVDSCCAYIAYLFKTAEDKELKEQMPGVDLSQMTSKEEEELREEYEWVLNIDKNRFLSMKLNDN